MTKRRNNGAYQAPQQRDSNNVTFEQRRAVLMVLSWLACKLSQPIGAKLKAR
jgi:hypothetical protein